MPAAAVVESPRSVQTSTEAAKSHHPLGKRARSIAAAEDSAMASRLPQDLVDLIVGCLADETDLGLLLRLRAVCGAWGKAVGSSFKTPRFTKVGEFPEGSAYLDIQMRNEVDASYHRHINRKARIVRRMYFCLCRDCEILSPDVECDNAFVIFARLLTPTARHHAAGATCTPHPPRALRPLGPTITHLDMSHQSYHDVVTNGMMKQLAELLPYVRSVRIVNCRGVTDINAFAAHALTELDISGACGVDTQGMSQLLYIRKLQMTGRTPVLLNHIAGRLTDLNISSSEPAEAFKADDDLDSSAYPALVSSPEFVMQRLTKLDVSSTEFECRDILRITPALTDLSLDSVKSPGDRDFTVPPGVPLRRLSLRFSNLQVHLEHCGDTLTELNASGADIGNEALEGLRALRKLTVQDNRLITRLTPVADTLTQLDAEGNDNGITDSSLSGLRRLRTLHVSHNTRVTSIVPFAETLTELHIDGANGLGHADFGIAPNLTSLSVWGEDCSIGDVNLKSCTTLTRLWCSENNRITTIRPFMETLEHLDCTANIPEHEIAAAPRLKYVE